MQFLKTLGYTEMNFSGCGIIMAEVAIGFKSELFYGDTVIVSVTTGEISKVGFELLYKLEKQPDDKTTLVATAKTGMICYDYGKKKMVNVPEEARQKLSK